MSARKLLIIGNYGAGNLGDDAILGGILMDLEALKFKGGLTVTHGGLRSSTDLYRNLKKIPFAPAGFRSRFKAAALEKQWAGHDLALFGGGGLFTDAESWKAPYIWYRQAKILQKLKIPYVILGQSVGPLKTPWARWWTRKAFQGARAIHLRDETSLKWPQRWGLSATVGTDFALSYLQASPKVARQELLLLSFRKWPGFSLERLLTLVKPINEWAKKQHLKPILLSMEPLKEREFLQAFPWETYYPSSAREAFLAFQKAKFAVTFRLHAGIFSLMASTPFLALAYSEKVTAFFKALGVDQVILEPLEWEEETLREALKGLSAPAFKAEALIQTNRAFLKQALELL
ncbi:polysaccharide pyruvyl transferase family protein [Candidatus Peregrinibacteria bacterium]|nr:MAG: polysaccharide pyruvyl transferase family protein [Candidatus Peregrinibacteria bacterium]